MCDNYLKALLLAWTVYSITLLFWISMQNINHIKCTTFHYDEIMHIIQHNPWMCLRQFMAQWQEHVHSGKHKTFAFTLLCLHRSGIVRSPPQNLPKCPQTCLLPECQYVMSAGRALVNRGAEKSVKLEMYSCAWRYTPTQGDKSSSSQPEARIRSGTRERARLATQSRW